MKLNYSNKSKEIALAIILFTSTIFSSWYAILGVLVKPQNSKLSTENYQQIRIASIIMLFSIINMYIGNILTPPASVSIQSFIPYTSLMIPTIIISSRMTSGVKNILLWLIVTEAVIVIGQYYFGVVSFWHDTADIYSEHIDSDLLYYSRPCGLSRKPSVVAVKLLLGLLLLEQSPKSVRVKSWMYIILFFAIALNFNRSVVIAVASYYSLDLLAQYKKLIQNNPFKASNLKYTSAVMLAVVIVAYYNYEAISYQMFRGFDNIIQSSQRVSIWMHGLDFISSNPFMGNHSMKYSFNINYHLHNSFLQVVATHGLIISILFGVLIYRSIIINGRGIILILVYSFFQYGIFWGISLLDIIFYSDNRNRQE